MTRNEWRKGLLADFIRAVWDEGDEAVVARYLAPAYRIAHDPGDGWDGQTLDRDGFRDRLRQSRAAFPGQRFEIVGLFADGDTVVMTWLWAATHLGDLPGFPASGRIIRMSGATAYGFDPDDRLIGHWQVTDRLSVYQQLVRNAQPG